MSKKVSRPVLTAGELERLAGFPKGYLGWMMRVGEMNVMALFEASTEQREVVFVLRQDELPPIPAMSMAASFTVERAKEILESLRLAIVAAEQFTVEQGRMAQARRDAGKN